MKRLYRTLEELLSRKVRLYKAFIEVLNQERTSVARYTREQLEDALEKKEMLMGKIDKLNQLREGVVHSIAEAKGISFDDITLKQIAAFPDNPWAQQMAENRDILRQQIQTISRLNAGNRNLIDRSALSLKKSMTWLYQIDAASTSYHADGRQSDVRLASRMVSMDV